jgi:hypothetical protein
MAQPGNFTPILLYGSSTPGNVPLAANLTNSATGSEIAINVADKNLFFKDSGGVVNTVPIRQSSTSSNGWLSSTDWNTFNNKTSNLGTVTSVAATVPAFLSISGSPITTSGTLAITLSGTALPIANGGTGITNIPTNGQLLIGNGSGYSLSTLSIGSGLSIVNGAGSITLANTQNAGPTFSATVSASQTINVNTWTKVSFNTAQWDTNSNYDAVTNYRFTPTVAGYYQVTMSVQLQTVAATYAIIGGIYKNGSSVTGAYTSTPAASQYNYPWGSGSYLVYCNGSTDYIESYVLITAATGTAVIVGGLFQAAMVRGA